MKGFQIQCEDLDFHTFWDLRLIQQSRDIEMPSVQTHFVEIPGRDGLLDLTEGLGRVCYSNRKIVLQYCAVGSSRANYEIIQTINRLHGKHITLRDDDDDYGGFYEDGAGYYYEGRASVSIERNSTHCIIILTVDAQPFRTAYAESVEELKATSTEQTCYIDGGDVPIVPTLEVTGGSVMVSMGDWTATLSPGKYTHDKLIIDTGCNEVRYKGSGTLTLRWKELRF